MPITTSPYYFLKARSAFACTSVEALQQLQASGRCQRNTTVSILGIPDSHKEEEQMNDKIPIPANITEVKNTYTARPLGGTRRVE